MQWLDAMRRLVDSGHSQRTATPCPEPRAIPTKVDQVAGIGVAGVVVATGFSAAVVPRLVAATLETRRLSAGLDRQQRSGRLSTG